MTAFTLTTNPDDFPGSSGTDTFSGPAGGDDTLLGKKGSDTFTIEYGQTGVIDGGTGNDKIVLIGGANNSFDAGLTIVGVEKLVTDNGDVVGTAAQLAGFTSYEIQNQFTEFYVYLKGAGGSLDFSASYLADPKLNIDANATTSAVKIVGSLKGNLIQGSDFNDSFNGGGGHDTIYGGAGNDKINGGKKSDHLYGDDGFDKFIFSDKLKSSNIDHIGDFRFQEDTIRLDHHIFEELDKGDLPKSAFKDIGTHSEDKSDRILYDSQTGHLFYDEDGKGGKTAVHFATLDNYSGDVPVLTYHEILVI